MTGEQEARKPRSLDLSAMTPKPVNKKPSISEVKTVAEGQGFTSRENRPAPAPTKPLEVGQGPDLPVISRRRGPRKKKRTESFNTRLKPETLQAIMDICDENTWGYADFVERALVAFQKQS